MKKLSEYIYKIPRDYHKWGANFASPRGHFNGIQSMPDARLNMGFDVILHETVMEFPHFHNAVEEYLMFVGSDLVKFFDFDAEIELWLGEDPDKLEKYVITAPTIVRIPPGLWHGPINFKRVGKPVAFSAVFPDGDRTEVTRRIIDGKTDYPYIASSLKRCVKDTSKPCTFCGECFKEMAEGDTTYMNSAMEYGKGWTAEIIAREPAPKTGKYDKCVFTIPVLYHNWGELYANPRGRFNGTGFLPEAKIYFGFSVAMKPHPSEVPHLHFGAEEYLWFTGSNLQNMFDFDAEIEVSLGYDPDHMEKFIITEPTVIRVPPGLWHCPYVFKRVDKPVNFMAMYLDGDWAKITRQKDEKGNFEYVFEGASLKKCVYNPELTCSYCGKCFQDRKNKAEPVK